MGSNGDLSLFYMLLRFLFPQGKTTIVVIGGLLTSIVLGLQGEPAVSVCADRLLPLGGAAWRHAGPPRALRPGLAPRPAE